MLGMSVGPCHTSESVETHSESHANSSRPVLIPHRDLAVYNASLDEAIDNVYNGSTPVSVTIGPRFYQGFNQWPGVKFINGLNQALNGTVGRENLLAEVNASCNIIDPENFLAWEYGNEADLYANNGIRPPPYNDSDYVADWLNGTAAINAEVQKMCPGYPVVFDSPSFGLYGAISNLDPLGVANDMIDANDDIVLWSLHLYMGSSSQLPTLQATLMNHTNIANIIAFRTGLAGQLEDIVDIPFAITEVNSILNVGVPGLTDVFGAALWAMDFQLWAAQTGTINRLFMQQGYEFPYASWAPVTATGEPVAGFPVSDFPIATRAPYYGDIASATALGDATNNNVSVIAVPIGTNETDSGYAVYENGKIARLVALNLLEWNATTTPRPNATYTFAIEDLSDSCNATVSRLIADSSNDKSGITLNGYSYDQDLNNGLPVKQAGIPSDETVIVEGGKITLTVPQASAAIVYLKCCKW